MRFLFLGQTSMGNRGCEALIRTNSALIRESFPDATFLCPSENAARDAAQWPDHASCGIEFVEPPPLSSRLLWWNRLRRLPLLDGLPPPAHPMAGFVSDMLERCDAVLMTGGDIISLDYQEFSLFHWAGLVEAFARAGKPVHLLAASVGPFSALPWVEQRMRDHLGTYASISVRETPSLDYVSGLGRKDAVLVADPAFTLLPQPCALPPLPGTADGVLGLNFSPLVRETRGDEEAKQAFDDAIVRFVASVLDRTEMDVLLIPHVYPLDGRPGNSDRDYMQGLAGRLADSGRVAVITEQLNTCQLKYAIGQCRYFIGARTHATVAALSQGVPTCSIAYSVKALGINRDLFGHTRYVLPTPDVTFETLWQYLDLLVREEAEFRALLGERIPEWTARARIAIPAVGAR